MNFQLAPSLSLPEVPEYNPETDFPRIPELILSYSSLSSWETCRRKTEFYKFYENSNYFQSTPGDAGNALHAGVQHYLVHHDKTAATWEFMCKFPWNLKHKYGWSVYDCLSALDKMLQDDIFLRYQVATVEDMHGIQHPAIEVPFKIRFKNLELPYGTKVSYIGYADLILFDLFEQKYIVADIKTHRDNNNVNQRVAKYAFDPQCIPYSMVLERMLGHSIDQFEIKYIDCFVDFMNPRVTVLPFHKTRADVNDYLLGFVDTIKSISDYYSRGWFPRTSKGGCYNFGSKCQYYDMCEYRDPKDIRNYISENSEESKPKVHDIWIEMELDLGIGG